MPLRYRPMKPEDVNPCIDILKHHPYLGPQYSKSFDKLAIAWASLLDIEACCALVFEEILEEQVRILGPGVWVAVSDQFAHELKTPPFFWMGPELTDRISCGSSPVLSNKELRDANSTAGINVVAWPSSPPATDVSRMDVAFLYMNAFVETVRGFHVKEAFFQTSHIEELRAVLQWGAAIATSDGLQTDVEFIDLDSIPRQPFVLVMNSQLASSRFGSWASGMFVIASPRIGFSRAEQHLLEAALRGLTDEDLASELQISLSAVKKNWRSIYSRVESNAVGILPTSVEERETGDRGKGKKHRILAYVSEHPEELRPVSMKLLRQKRVAVTHKTSAMPVKV